MKCVKTEWNTDMPPGLLWNGGSCGFVPTYLDVICVETTTFYRATRRASCCVLDSPRTEVVERPILFLFVVVDLSNLENVWWYSAKANVAIAAALFR